MLDLKLSTQQCRGQDEAQHEASGSLLASRFPFLFSPGESPLRFFLSKVYREVEFLDLIPSL